MVSRGTRPIIPLILKIDQKTDEKLLLLFQFGFSFIVLLPCMHTWWHRMALRERKSTRGNVCVSSLSFCWLHPSHMFLYDLLAKGGILLENGDMEIGFTYREQWPHSLLLFRDLAMRWLFQWQSFTLRKSCLLPWMASHCCSPLPYLGSWWGWEVFWFILGSRSFWFNFFDNLRASIGR